MKKLPPCFAFKNSGKHPRKEEIKKRFNELSGADLNYNLHDCYYVLKENRSVCVFGDIKNFGSTVVEITEDDFLDMTEPELTELPDNFYFQYVDEKDREVLKKRFRYNYIFSNIGSYYGKNANLDFCRGDKDTVPENSIEITQADFIRLTEPEIVNEHLPKPDFPYKGDIKDFPKEVVEWMLDNQVKQGNKRDISVFEVCRWCNRVNGGFDFDDATEGGDFWQTIFGVT